jgi:RND family efflux transporter MFP subunit
MKKNILIFILALFFSVFYACGEKKETEKKVESKRLRPVKAVEVIIPENGTIKFFSGITKASVSSKLSFKVSGTISDVYVDKGDKVEKGSLVAELDPKDFELKLEEALASLERAEAGFENAQSIYKRTTALYEKGHASAKDADDARAAYISASAMVRASQKQAELVKRSLEYTKLFSPMDCRVGSVHAEQNENISAGMPVVVLNCGNRFEVNIQVPSLFLDKLDKSKPVSVKIDSLENKEFKGRIKEIGSSPDALNTSYPVTIALEKEVDKIMTGMSALVGIESRFENRDLFPVLPPVCVGEDSKGNFIWKILPEDKNTGIIKKAYIETGNFAGSKITVKKGVEKGELVVCAGINQVYEGLKVRIEQAIK